MVNILSLILEAIFPTLVEIAKNIFGLENNIEALKKAIVELEATSADVLTDVEIQERQGLQPLEVVQLWIRRVDATGLKVYLLLEESEAELQRLFMHGYWSDDFMLTNRYGKMVSKRLKEVEFLLSTNPSKDVLARRGVPPHIVKSAFRHTIGLENMLASTWERLMDDQVGILGLHGMGGVGKTTLLGQLNNEFLGKWNEFPVVIFVVVSQDVQIRRIQKEIGKRVGLDNNEWEEKSEHERASDIRTALERKRFVMLFDDIWKKVSLEDIGIPLPSRENRSKVVFTTRSKGVCKRMEADVEMEVKCLGREDAWKLFESKVGLDTLASDRRIPELAKNVCRKCQGLPLALIVIGGTMASKSTFPEWKDAIRVLESNAADFSEVEVEILPVLKFSYDALKDDQKLCFQYCALFPEDEVIPKDELVNYWIHEGFSNGSEGIENQTNEGYAKLEVLINASLLMNGETKEFDCVKMHDVVRQLALWIASNFGKEKENFVVKTGAKVCQMPEVVDKNMVKRISLADNQIETISNSLHCPNLTTLFLQQNKLVNISGDFFLSMPKLVVLDLSSNEYLNKLPEEVSNLVALRDLRLAATNLEELPIGLRKLIQLRHLDISLIENLQSISVISSLLNLETLKVFGSTPLCQKSIDDIKLMNNLKFLSATITDDAILEYFLRMGMASWTTQLFLRGLYVKCSIVLKGFLARLDTLAINGCATTDILVDLYHFSRSVNHFENLRSVTIARVKNMSDLTWLLFAPSLTSLHVIKPSPKMKEIISRGKAGRMMRGSNIIPFQKLCTLFIDTSTELESIYWQPLDFPNLLNIYLIKCPKLEKLPLHNKSANGNNFRLFVDQREWLDRVKWEDEATKDRFLLLSEVMKPSNDVAESI